MSRRLIAILAAALLCWSWAAGQDVGALPDLDPPVYALTGAMVHTVSGGVVENATVVIRDGLIEAVGAGIQAPPDARELDLSGLHVYPGLIDALTENGLRRQRQGSEEEGRGRGSRGAGGDGDEHPEGPGLYAHVHAADLLDPDLGDKLDSWRESGVSVLNVAPSEGIFMGYTALVALNSSNDTDRMIIASPSAFRMSFEGLPRRTYPGSLLGVIAHIKQTLLDARRYGEIKETYANNPAGLKRPETDRALEALQPVVNRSVAAVFPAKRARQIRRVLSLASEFDFKPVIAGGFEADQAAEELKAAGVPVLYSLDFPKKPRDAHPDFEESLEAIRYRVNAPRVPAKLAEAGVKFAFYSDGSRNPRDFWEGLRKTVEEGLSREDALRAATLSAAEILGAERQLGSVEQGKIANLVVADGDLFDKESQIRHVFVDGEKFDIPEKKKKPATGGEPVDFAGIWDVSVFTPEGTEDMQFELSVAGQALTGRVISDELGSLEIYEGSVEGSTFSFKISADLGQGPVEITVSGSASGYEMTGSADVAGLGAAPLEGSKIP